MKWHSIAIGSVIAVIVLTAYIILAPMGAPRTEGYSNRILPLTMEDPQPAQVVSTGCFTGYNDCSMLNDCCRQHAIDNPQDAIHTTDCGMWAKGQAENPKSYLNWINWGATLLSIPSYCRYNPTPDQ